GLIKGIKARMVSPALEIFGMEMPRLAKRAAREAGVPLMVHIGDTTKRYDPNVIRELLPLLEPGDIVTHLFTANPGGVLDTNGKQDRLGSLAVGRQADISVLEVRDGSWVVYDTLRDSMKIDKTIVPVLTVKRGKTFEPEWGPHPWGWEPQPA